MTATQSPSSVDLALELPCAALSFGRFALLAPYLRRASASERHPVLVLPGFLASDRSTAALRLHLRSMGYPAYSWRLGRNIGPTHDVVTGLRSSLDQLADKHGTKLSLIGWSLGGVMARELGRLDPDRVRQVITLGSPIGLEDARQSRASERYARFSALHDDHYRLGESYRPNRDPLPVPSSSIYTRHDGIVAWQTCIQRVDERSENIEVRGAHVGLGNHPAAVLAITDRLAQPENEWRPFRPPALVRHWYPAPDTEFSSSLGPVPAGVP